GEPPAAAEHHDVLPLRSQRKADAERADHVEVVALLQRRKPVGAAADALVEKLEPFLRSVDAVDALRPAQPQLALIGCGAQQIEELAGPHRDRLGRGLDHEVLVFGVDPLVGNDRAERLLDRDVAIDRLTFPDHKGSRREWLGLHEGLVLLCFSAGRTVAGRTSQNQYFSQFLNTSGFRLMNQNVSYPLVRA